MFKVDANAEGQSLYVQIEWPVGVPLPPCGPEGEEEYIVDLGDGTELVVVITRERET